MKYRFLLRILRFLVYGKRFLWWMGRRLSSALAAVVGWLYRPAIYLRFKLASLLRRIGIESGREWLWKRDFLQIILLVILFVLAVPHTVLTAKPDPLTVGKKTIV